MERDVLKELLQLSREKETAHGPSQATWNVSKKSFGQCKVTALLVQEIRGGDIISGDAKKLCNSIKSF